MRTNRFDIRGRAPRRAAAAAFVTAVAAALLPAGAAAQATVTLRLTANAPAKSPWAVQIDRLAAKVAEESKGTVKLEPFYGGQLGNEQDTIQQVARGRIDSGFFAVGAGSLLVPELQLAILPAFFSSPAELDCVLDKHLAKPFDELLAAKGVKLLGYGEVGVIDLIGKKAFATPADVKGHKAITYSKTQSIMWSALGANSTFIGVPEWSSALQTGVVDIGGAPVSLYVPGGINKVAPVLTRTQLWDSVGMFLVNRATWEKMSADQRAAVERALAVENAVLWRKEIRGLEAKLREAHVAGGGQVVETTAEQRAAWRKAIAPAWPEMVKSIGGQGEKLFKVIESAREACK
ncbi:MAG: TRAP transporter substrate-binding protein [Burkholderiaceae bacterium]